MQAGNKHAMRLDSLWSNLALLLERYCSVLYGAIFYWAPAMCCEAVPGAGDTRMAKLQFMPQNSDSLLERQVTRWIVIWYDEGDAKDPTGAQLWVSNPLWCVVDCDRSHQSWVLFFLLLWSLSKGGGRSISMRWILFSHHHHFPFLSLSPQQDKHFF